MFNWFKKFFNKRESELTDNSQGKTGSFNLTNELLSLAQDYKNECEYLKERKYV